MTAITRRCLIAVLAILVPAAIIPAAAGPVDKPDEIKLVKVKYADLFKTIAANKSAKLTMVDAWATWCGPCKENFPHVVEMHAKYAKQGLAVASLCMDDVEKPKKVAEATAFLKQSKATFTNFLLDESNEDGFAMLKITAIPSVFLFGPDGKEVKRFTLDDPDKLFTYEQVEEFVKNYLEARPTK